MAGQLKLFELPLFITERNKYFVLFMGFLVAGTMYLLPNHFHIFPPQLLTMTSWDQAVPFIPETVWIYLTEYIFFIAVYLSLNNMYNVNKYFWAFMGMQTFAVMIFWVWPTTFPRDLFPLPADLDPVTHWAFSTLRAADTPANCAPSLHVSSVYLASFTFLRDKSKKFAFFMTWATAIALSTLPTKQHYIIDVVLGLALAVGVYIIFDRFVGYRGYKALGTEDMVPVGDQAKR